tara:strand:- start:148 stop:792 length:645 start_codon:yes stop_codon:yes gene_type:complete
MSFPDAGQTIPAAEANSNIKFSDLRLSYINNEGSGGDEGLNNEEGVLNLSLFRNATFTSGDPIPGEGAISIGTDFCGKTFGAEGGGGGSANIRVTLTDSFGDGWDDDGDGGEGTTNNFLIVRDSGSNVVFNNTNTDDDGLTEQSETKTFDITLSAGEYTVEVSLASGQSSFGEFASDMSYSITLISNSSVLDSYDFGSEGVPESGNYTSSFTVS